MENEAELIREQMAETRKDLTEKLDALQEQVLGTVVGTTRSVTQTVEAVQEAVQDTVGTVKDSVQETVESVKSAFDLSEQMQKHPWLLMGGAVLAGFVAERLLMGRDYTALPPPSDGSPARPAPSRTEAATSAVRSAATSAATSTASLLESMAGPVLKEAEKLAFGVLAGVAADLVKTSAPEAMRGQLNEMVEKFASSVGVKPMSGLFAHDQAGNGQSRPQATASQAQASKPVCAPGGFTPPSPAI